MGSSGLCIKLLLRCTCHFVLLTQESLIYRIVKDLRGLIQNVIERLEIPTVFH